MAVYGGLSVSAMPGIVPLTTISTRTTPASSSASRSGAYRRISPLPRIAPARSRTANGWAMPAIGAAACAEAVAASTAACASKAEAVPVACAPNVPSRSGVGVEVGVSVGRIGSEPISSLVMTMIGEMDGVAVSSPAPGWSGVSVAVGAGVALRKRLAEVTAGDIERASRPINVEASRTSPISVISADRSNSVDKRGCRCITMAPTLG